MAERVTMSAAKHLLQIINKRSEAIPEAVNFKAKKEKELWNFKFMVGTNLIK